ncbi:methylated-DNA--[protein]-cysteine S-methyltransferase [Seohaeicola zhoushanensis]|uniref:Methylated-DNA--protein-cysteine methyltransferase n=1 Tax=Seohaeicola zhoushanensis TaxID=1569283 RepID=A0A8J3M9R3_9RHOB|nr:methylated-DNA--[protein]-cysteine S-methyltransferase [Seohaeicola zhoushanensis]GHF68191.1 methylated-DNA--protein-cysteine methyltransferase [Seohaeicola zhoushanensis]
MKRSISSPLGPLVITADAGALTGLTWSDDRHEDDDPLLREAERQLAAYFARALETFDLPLRVEASAFQRAVCDAMLAIPYGHTRTYGDLARDLGATPQAVGQGCGGNPLPIVIPCHRVLGANGLGGFSARGGVETKVALLRHEGAAGLLI